MKRLLIAATLAFVALINPAAAADKGGPTVAEFLTDETPIRSWTGFYLGAHGGLTVGQNDASVNGAPGLLGGIEADAALVGLHAGYDMRISGTRLVAGLMVDYTYSGMKAGADAMGGLVKAEYDVQHQLSASGRLGYLLTDRMLAYVYGGYTYGYTSDLVVTIGGAPFAKVNMPDLKGWHAGIGTEFRMSDHWSIKADYRLTEYATEDIANTVKFDNRDHAIRLGAAYRF